MPDRQPIVQPSNHVGDLLRKLLDVSHATRGQRPRGALIAARRAADPEVDPAREQGLEHAELLRHLQRAVVAQHHAAGSDPDA